MIAKTFCSPSAPKAPGAGRGGLLPKAAQSAAPVRDWPQAWEISSEQNPPQGLSSVPEGAPPQPDLQQDTAVPNIVWAGAPKSFKKSAFKTDPPKRAKMVPNGLPSGPQNPPKIGKNWLRKGFRIRLRFWIAFGSVPGEPHVAQM